jgi:peptidoglycan/LPS O-acetylase OafA/YrhL
VLGLQNAGPASRILSHPGLADLGRDLSCAAYLWHLPIYLLLIPLIPSLWIRTPLSAALTVLNGLAVVPLHEAPNPPVGLQKLEPAVVRSVPDRARELTERP